MATATDKLMTSAELRAAIKAQLPRGRKGKFRMDLLSHGADQWTAVMWMEDWPAEAAMLPKQALEVRLQRALARVFQVPDDTIGRAAAYLIETDAAIRG